MLTATRNEIEISLPAAFEDLFTPSRYKLYFGGRGAAKSRSFATALTTKAYEQPLRILCTREIQNSIEDSVLRLLKDTIERLQLDSFFEVKKREIVGYNGSLFLFEGLRHNVKKIKSFEGIDIAWIEEAEAVSQSSLDVLIPTIRKPNSEIWASFNPDSPDDPIYKMATTSPPHDAIIRKVSWQDNPWFPQVLRNEMEWDRAHDIDKFNWIWDGQPRSMSDAQVFRGKFVVDAFETPDNTDFYMGADWGFSKDPSTLLRSFIKDRRLYIDNECYGVGVEIEELPQFFDAILPRKTWPVRADSQRPDTISFMRKHGYNVIGAKKGHNSIEDGIEFLRSFEKIVIHPRCKHTIDEFKMYSYKVDRMTGDVLPIIVDAHNHCIDAIRYAIEPIMAKVGPRAWVF